jgi:hypothetical protein
MRRTAACATRKPPKAETAIDFSTSAGSSSINGPRTR